jgi:hypothetical protein
MPERRVECHLPRRRRRSSCSELPRGRVRLFAMSPSRAATLDVAAHRSFARLSGHRTCRWRRGTACAGDLPLFCSINWPASAARSAILSRVNHFLVELNLGRRQYPSFVRSTTFFARARARDFVVSGRRPPRCTRRCCLPS